MKAMIYRLVPGLAVFVFFSASHAANQTRLIKHVLPNNAYETCFQLMAKETFRYTFSSSSALDFNLHYHLGEHVAYPQEQLGIKQYGSTYTAKITHDYCMMWTNTGDKLVQLKVEHNASAD